jgi:ribosomal-protein-alanine N-acetyltransferase
MQFELRTQRFLLRDLHETDFDVVHPYGCDLEVVRYQDWGPNTEADTRDFLTRSVSSAQVEPRAAYELAVVELSTNTLLGTVGLYVDERGTQGMMGYCFAKHAWGRGVATEAARAVMRFGFDDLRLHRVWAGCDPDNVRSRRVLEKLGMRQEGHLRESVFVRSEFRDRLLFGILHDEWRPAADAASK